MLKIMGKIRRYLQLNEEIFCLSKPDFILSFEQYEGIEEDSGRGSSLSAVSSASTLSPVSVTSRGPGNMDSSSIGQLLKTLNSIVVSVDMSS